MPSKLDDLVFRVEAVLFASGKPLSAKEIAAGLELEDSRPVQRAVRTLEQTYANRQSALEVRRVADRYALQLREEYVPSVQAVTPVEMAPRTLRALTLIAYHQPVLQSVLVRMIGEVAYEEVQHLRGLGLVRTEPKGSTLELSTTRRFAEYFGISGGRPEAIRRFLEEKLGVPAAPTPPGAPPAQSTAGSEPPASDLDGGTPSPEPAVLATGAEPVSTSPTSDPNPPPEPAPAPAEAPSPAQNAPHPGHRIGGAGRIRPQ